ncbi:MAG: manganese efflux pump MntP family protein [Bacteroidota bacterium]|nr:manganese efflux pump MntP family protein [Bacteroidota bacterium]
MDFITIFLIALGLSMDAVAVAISMGLSINSLRIRHGLLIGLFFGAFQAIMPVLGWAAGRGLKDFISGVDHWIAFGLLTIIGVKMIYESIKGRPMNDKIKQLNIYILFMLSIATSIDALAIGISFAFLQSEIITPILIIGIVTFVLSFLGVGFGKHVGYLLPKRIEIVGGIILIGIGTKILLEHLGLIS